MTISRGPIYETTFFVDPDRAAEFDAWLDAHAVNARQVSDVVDCRVIPIADDDDGRHGRICQYVLTDDDVVDSFLEGFGTDVEGEAEARFDVLFSSRMLREDTAHDVAPDVNPDCLNCGTRLRGQYCGTCGQRSRSRLISLWELISDAFGDLFEIDSRIWKTLIPLLFRPGQLTRDYLAGKRARFMPPFRSYLVLSLLFFLVAFFDPLGDLGLDPQDEAASAAEREEAVRERDEALAELAEKGIVIGDELPPEVAEEIEALTEDGPGLNIRLDGDEGEVDCDVDAADLEGMPPFLAGIITPERVEHICRRAKSEPTELFDALLDNIPAALIVLLPIMALVLKMLYPLSRHYYVEHLLFFVHFHAFFFLLLTLQILLGRLGGFVFIPEALRVLAIVVASFYVPIYLFIAMRRVYGQGRFATFLKYLVLTVAYAGGFTLTMLGAFAIAALSI